MPDVVAFKSGKDLGERADEDAVSCVDCGAMESDDAAYQQWWQLVPPVCPNCLRWKLADEVLSEAMS